jgi:Rad3-related DNA helicase
MEYGEEYQVCPHALAMEVSQSADMVIGDYNYAFDPYMGFSTLFRDGWDEWVVLVDEAHNLVGRGRGYGSPGISQGDADLAVEWLQESYGSDALAHISIVKEISGIISNYEYEVDSGTETEWEIELNSAEFRGLVERVDRAAVDYLLLRASRPQEGDLYKEFTRKLKRFVDVLENSGDETLHVYTESLNGSRGLRLVCLDPSVFMRRQFSAFSSAVLMSATLRPMTYHRDLLGLSHDKVIEAEHPSPFPSANRGVFLATRVSTAYRDRTAHLTATVAMISEVVSATPGNAAVYYSSYAVMRSMASKVKVAGRTNRIQQPSMSDDERKAFLSNLTETGGATTLHAVLGGIFSEGVDLPSGSLKSVVVVGPALPPVGLERRRISEWCEDRHGDGFSYAFLIPGMAKVVQAAGRLIRSSEDRGAVVLIGRRFGWRDYRALLPEDWTVFRPDDPASAVEEFFGVTLPSESHTTCVKQLSEA